MAKKKTDSVEVRVLADVEVNGVKLPSGVVALVNSEQAAAYSNSLDASADAVAYAKAEGACVVDATAEESPE